MVLYILKTIKMAFMRDYSVKQAIKNLFLVRFCSGWGLATIRVMNLVCRSTLRFEFGIVKIGSNG